MGLLDTPLVEIAPPSQKSRPLALVITDDGSPVWFHIFLPRPEEVSFTHPTRAAINQTFAGGWVDDFGPGLVDIAMSGHTGWRGANLLLANVPGEVMAYNLRNACINLYHARRAQKRQAAQDPDLVEMLFLDTLNLTSYVVYPVSFQLRRHKSRPLLYQYQIKLTALREFYTLESLASDIGDLFGDVTDAMSGGGIVESISGGFGGLPEVDSMFA